MLSGPPTEIRMVPLQGIPLVRPGDDLSALIIVAARHADVSLANGVLVVCQKTVSKAEGRIVDLATIEPSEEARRIAAEGHSG